VEELGLLLGLGAALAHASINFVLMTPLLAALIGIIAGLAGLEPARAGRLSPPPRLYTPTLNVLMVLVFVGYVHLALDVVAAAVYHGQRAVPGAAVVRSDPQKLLAFSRWLQNVKPDRGVPLLAEATIVQEELTRQPESWFYRQQLLSTYGRALALDPWNPRGHLLFYDFLAAYPDLVEQVEPRHQPGTLLQSAIALDPIFLPAYDRIVHRFRRLGRPELAYVAVRDNLGPWLPWLYLNDSRSAETYLTYLRDWATRLNDRATLATLERREQAMRSVIPEGRTRWFFDEG